MRKDTRVIVLCWLVFVATATTTFAAPDMVLKFAGQNAPGHPVTLQMEAIAEEIARKTDGRIKLKIFPANQLGGHDLVYEELIRGTMDLSCTSVSARFDPRTEMVHLSGFVSTYEDLERKFATGSWLSLQAQKISSPLGVKHLGFLVEGMSGTGTIQPLVEPFSSKAARRTYFHTPQTHRSIKKTTGYKSVAIPDAELYGAIWSGLIDGISGYSVATAYAMFGDVLKYWYANNSSLNVLSLMSSSNTWVKINSEDQRLIYDIFSNATFNSISSARKNDEKYIKLMKEKGIKVVISEEKDINQVKMDNCPAWSAIHNLTTQ